MTREPDCLFCSIVAGDIPSARVAEDERTVAFMDVNPASDGHLLVVPREHSQDLLAAGADDLTACVLMAQRLAARAVDVLGADGVNVLSNTGAAAWQSVFHLHVHVIPRYADDPTRDRLRLPWTPSGGGDADAIAATADRLREA